MDDSNIISQDEFVGSSNDLDIDIETGMFITEVQVGKRTGKNKKLKEELFDSTVYVYNQCGFSTLRPLVWVKAVNNYIKAAPCVYGKFFYKPMKNDNKYSVIKLNLCNQLTRKVEIQLNLLTKV